MEKRLSTVTLDWATGGSVGRRCYGRKIEEYMADFCGTAKRVLTASDHQIFRYHFLLGADFNLCCRQLHLDKGTFFRRVYRVMSILGREFAEMQPYGLYPVDEYFGTVLRRTAPVVESIEPARRRRRRKAAETEQPELLKIA